MFGEESAKEEDDSDSMLSESLDQSSPDQSAR